MLRVAVPYGELSARQLRTLADIAREYDRGYGHFTTRQNLQFNWIPLVQSADVMDLLAQVDMHGIQTSGNCIRNITSDALAGIAADELIDPRPYCEVLRQWSTLHPEFAFLPRKFKIAVTGAAEDRAAIAWHDIGLHLRQNAQGEVGFEVLVGGGMGRTPIIGTAHPRVPALAADPRLHRGDRARLQPLRPARQPLQGAHQDPGQGRGPEVLRRRAGRIPADPRARRRRCVAPDPAIRVRPRGRQLRAARAGVAEAGGFGPPRRPMPSDQRLAYARWLERNVHAHQVPGYRAVTLSLKRAGQAPGDVTAEQMESAAAIAERFSHGELRVTHDQNLLLPWVREASSRALWEAAKAAASPRPTSACSPT